MLIERLGEQAALKAGLVLAVLSYFGEGMFGGVWLLCGTRCMHLVVLGRIGDARGMLSDRTPAFSPFSGG
jgi:hypothetical protein